VAQAGLKLDPPASTSQKQGLSTPYPTKLNFFMKNLVFIYGQHVGIELKWIPKWNKSKISQ
jgi:hypothetical protein